MTSPSRVVAAIVVASLLPTAARADWPSSPTTNLPVCTAAGMQSGPVVTTDGSGGAIVAWQDSRSGTADIYAHHLLASGAVDPLWGLNGRAVCTFTGSQINPRIASDGQGGAIIAWQDVRSGTTSDIYAQHVLASGTLDASWPAGGLGVCTAAGEQNSARIVSDGAGGAIVAWLDFRSDTVIFAQHVLINGTVDPVWPANGRPLGGRAGNHQTFPLIADGSGGAIASWADYLAGPVPDIRAQRVLGNGSLAPGWPADGVVLCAATGAQLATALVSDKLGGAIVAWQDGRSGAGADIYAQHVKASGGVDTAWPVDGIALCSAPADQVTPMAVSDGAGGALVVWRDARLNFQYDLYDQHVSRSGVLDPNWPADGAAFSSAFGGKTNVALAPDGAGGFLAAWDDSRNGGFDQYAHHVLATGAPDPAWPVDGRAISTATSLQNAPSVIGDGSGGLIAAWNDQRNGGLNWDIYAQRVQADGTLGGTVVSVPSDPDVRIELESVRPNPSRGDELRVLFSGTVEQGIELTLLDVTGRLVASRDLAALGSGAHELRFDDLPHLPPGLYFVALRSRSDVRASRILRVVVLR